MKPKNVSTKICFHEDFSFRMPELQTPSNTGFNFSHSVYRVHVVCLLLHTFFLRLSPTLT